MTYQSLYINIYDNVKHAKNRIKKTGMQLAALDEKDIDLDDETINAICDNIKEECEQERQGWSSFIDVIFSTVSIVISLFVLFLDKNKGMDKDRILIIGVCAFLGLSFLDLIVHRIADKIINNTLRNILDIKNAILIKKKIVNSSKETE